MFIAPSKQRSCAIFLKLEFEPISDSATTTKTQTKRSVSLTNDTLYIRNQEVFYFSIQEEK